MISGSLSATFSGGSPLFFQFSLKLHAFAEGEASEKAWPGHILQALVEIPAERQMAKAVAMIVMIAMAMPRSGHQRACIITCPGNHKNDKDDTDGNATEWTPMGMYYHMPWKPRERQGRRDDEDDEND